MDFNDYHHKAMATRLPTAGHLYALLGISGEVGELHSYLAKHVRDGGELDHQHLKKELGDILWFITAIADDYDLDLADIAEANISKLQARQKNGTLQGSGDNR